MTRILRGYLGLGSNLGDREHNLAAALAELRLDLRFTLSSASALYSSAPWGYASQHGFINQVIECQWRGTAAELWELLQAVQSQGQREQQAGQAYADRTIDLDILDIDPPPAVQASAGLLIPHPRAHARAFVLIPWQEIAPQHSLLGQPLAHWIAALPRQELDSLRRIAGAGHLARPHA